MSEQDIRVHFFDMILKTFPRFKEYATFVYRRTPYDIELLIIPIALQRDHSEYVMYLVLSRHIPYRVLTCAKQQVTGLNLIQEFLFAESQESPELVGFVDIKFFVRLKG